MKLKFKVDSETARIFVVLGLLTAMAILALNWALFAPREESFESQEIRAHQ